MLSKWRNVVYSFSVKLPALDKSSLPKVIPKKSEVNRESLSHMFENEKPPTKIYEPGSDKYTTNVGVLPWLLNKRNLMEDGHLFPADGFDQPETSMNPTRYTLEKQTDRLTQLLSNAENPKQQLMALRRISSLLLTQPHAQSVMIKKNMISAVLRAREFTTSSTVYRASLKALAQLGYTNPPKGQGVRILCLDGGGTRNIAIKEQLRCMEEMAGKPINEMFDIICGVSAGAILATLVCGLKIPVKDTDVLFDKVLREVFKRDFWAGTYRLVTKHAYYDSKQWDTLLKEVYAETALIDSAKDGEIPKFVAVSAIVTSLGFRPYVFRNYNPPESAFCDYEGSSHHKVWEALRASSAAPGYFEEFVLDGQTHQDGGVILNNPTAVAIHEAHLLWPDEPIQCCVSIGSGRYPPTTYLDPKRKAGGSSLLDHTYNLIRRATDTEPVHRLVNDLMAPGTYFRFNPPLSDYVDLDENRVEKLDQVKTDTLMYIRKNDYNFKTALKCLFQERSLVNKMKDKQKLIKLMCK